MSWVAKRIDVPKRLRSKILIANRHACCICRRRDIQIHHINSDSSDNSPDNLAVLCHDHHDRATAPPGLSARLRPEEIIEYKRDWETACTVRSLQVARGRAAFFMVDYKNCDRIRQLYASLSRQQFRFAADILYQQMQEEHQLRQEQGFAESIEPTTDWSPTIESFLADVAHGVVHPKVFEGAPGHPADPYFPTVEWQRGSFFLYDVWCQIMVRAIVAASWVYTLDELLALDEPRTAMLEGAVVSFRGELDGRVYPPDKWEKHRVGRTTLTVENEDTVWRGRLNLKTHYVYSDTGAMSLEAGVANGILLLRGVAKVAKAGGKRSVDFNATPLIIGSGELRIPGVDWPTAG